MPEEGTITYYSKERGFGWITDQSGRKIFLHISNFTGLTDPEAGDQVVFDRHHNARKDREEAKNVELIQRPPKAFFSTLSSRPARKLDGFPCIRDGHVRGFRVARTIGKVYSSEGWIRETQQTIEESKAILIKCARGKGANAVFHFRWHTEPQSKGWGIFKTWTNWYWVEGEAVVLVPE